MDQLEQLARVGETFTTLVEQVSAEGGSAATPCGTWSVRELTSHVVVGNRALVATLQGEPPLDRSVDYLGEDWAAAHRSSVAALVDALAQPGMLTRLHRTPLGEAPGSVIVALRTVEHAVHGWDLAVATGQSTEPLNGTAAAVYQPSVAMLTQLPAGLAHPPFAESREIAPDRPPIERLAALLGRDPEWHPPGG